MTQSAQAGINFPVGRIGRMLRDSNFTSRVGASAPVALAAVIEYIVAEIMEVAGNFCKQEERQRITPRHI